MDNIKVSICIVTYNHEKYIEKCLRSILEQETDFEFEVIVGEDASTDNTRNIIISLINEYPKRIIPVFHEKNVGACQNYISVHSKAKGEYICHLDGDDYALPMKLQKCSDLLDLNHDVGIVFHRVELNYGDEISPDLLEFLVRAQKYYSQEDFLSIGSIATHSSKMYRSHLRLAKYPHDEFLDYYVDVIQLENTKAYIINEILGGYTVGVGVSRTHTKLIYQSHLYDFCKLFPQKRKYIKANMLNLYLIGSRYYNKRLFKLKDFLGFDFLFVLFAYSKLIKYHILMKCALIKSNKKHAIKDNA